MRKSGNIPVNGKRRRCTATAKSTGQRCRKWAVVTGYAVCGSHGASYARRGRYSQRLPQVTAKLRAGMRRQALQELSRGIGLVTLDHVGALACAAERLAAAEAGDRDEEWEAMERALRCLLALRRALTALVLAWVRVHRMAVGDMLAEEADE